MTSGGVRADGPAAATLGGFSGSTFRLRDVAPSGARARRAHLQEMSCVVLSFPLSPWPWPACPWRRWRPPPPPPAREATTQLPRGVVPSHYDVSIVPHADKLTFDGKVAITIDVIKPTSTITLNAADLTFSGVSLTPAEAARRDRRAEGVGGCEGADRHVHLRQAVPAGSTAWR